MTSQTRFIVQSVLIALLPEDRVWSDEESATSRILGYGALQKHIQHGAPGHFFRLVKRTVREEVIEEPHASEK
jgi:uncharacterized protein (UPF0548 family)